MMRAWSNRAWSAVRRLVLLGALATLASCASNPCDADQCLGSDDICYGPCVPGTTCTTTPRGACSAPSPGGVSCCESAGGTGGGGGCCAAWTCNGSSQCASTMGGPSGNQCGFSDASACNAWCQKYIPGACSCSC